MIKSPLTGRELTVLTILTVAALGWFVASCYVVYYWVTR